MRTLHPLGADERLIAQGVYQRRQATAQVAYTESWSKHALADDAVLTRIDQDSRYGDAWSCLVEVLHNGAHDLQRITSQMLMHAADAPFKRLRLDYIFYEDEVQLSIERDAAQRIYTEWALPDAAQIVLPAYRVFWGEFIMAGLNRHSSLLMPGLATEEGAEVLHAVDPPRVLQQTAEKLQLQKAWDTVRYDMEDGRICWCDQYSIPLRYADAAAGFEDTLINYAHR